MNDLRWINNMRSHANDRASNVQEQKNKNAIGDHTRNRKIEI